MVLVSMTLSMTGDSCVISAGGMLFEHVWRCGCALGKQLLDR
jgi:hypothetical protein